MQTLSKILRVIPTYILRWALTKMGLLNYYRIPPLLSSYAFQSKVTLRCKTELLHCAEMIRSVSLDDIQAIFSYDSSNGTSTLKARCQSHQVDLSGQMSIQATSLGWTKKAVCFLCKMVQGYHYQQGAGQVHLKVDIDNSSVDVLIN